MVAARLLQHVCHELGSDGGPALVLLVLASVGEEGNHGRNTLRTGDLACVDHNAKLNERGVHLSAAGVDDVDVVLPHRLYDAHMTLADSTLRDLGAAERYSEPREGARRSEPMPGMRRQPYPLLPSSYDLCKLRVAGTCVPHRPLTFSPAPDRLEPRYAPEKILIPLPVNILGTVHETIK